MHESQSDRARKRYCTVLSCTIPAIVSCLFLFLFLEAAASLSELRAADTAAIDFSTVETVYENSYYEGMGEVNKHERNFLSVTADWCMQRDPINKQR